MLRPAVFSLKIFRAEDIPQSKYFCSFLMYNILGLAHYIACFFFVQITLPRFCRILNIIFEVDKLSSKLQCFVGILGNFFFLNFV